MAFTGAGISVPSGIPDFRSPGGLWTRFDPQEVATIEALRHRPRRVWEFLLEAVDLFDRSRPNPAHQALVDLQRAGRLGLIVTQNIDGLHQAAGATEVVEFHGGCRRFSCMECGQDHDPALARRLTPQTIPWLCGCGGLVRPDVVFFGEGIPPQALTRAFATAEAADFCCIVGTSGEVAPANLLPRQVKANGGVVVEINLGPTHFAGLSDVRLDAQAEVVLPQLVARILGKDG